MASGSQPLQQLLPHHWQVFQGIYRHPHLVTPHAGNRDLDLLSGG
jgi:hypothetical protein